MIRTTRQLHGAAHNADATFNAIPEALTLPEPRLLFLRPPLLRLVTGLRDGNLLHAELAGQLLIRWREQSLVTRQNARSVPEPFLIAV